MQTIYCIPGLGADEGVFQYLDLSFADVVFLKWLSPLRNETLQNYALRMKEQITVSNPVIFGLSLGGMIAVEIGKVMSSAKVIIISSAKTAAEIPFYWRFFGYLPVYKILPEWSIKKSSVTRKYFLGVHTNETINYVQKVTKHADADFYRWAVGAIVNWKNKTVPLNVVHLHGTNDNLLPFRFVQADIIIDNGGHLMIIENAEEVSGIIKNILTV